MDLESVLIVARTVRPAHLWMVCVDNDPAVRDLQNSSIDFDIRSAEAFREMVMWIVHFAEDQLKSGATPLIWTGPQHGHCEYPHCLRRILSSEDPVHALAYAIIERHKL